MNSSQRIRMKWLPAFLLAAALGIAQQITVNGSEHPELIPDEAAALAVFSVHSVFDTPSNIANTERHHAKLNLSPADHAIFDGAMQAYHNNKRGRATAFSNLLLALSPDGRAKLKAFIHAEKAHMQYHVQEAIEQ